MLIRGMVEHEIHEHTNPAPVRFRDQTLEITQRPEPWIDGAVIRHVVPKILHRRGINRREPDRINPERLWRAVVKVIQAARDPGQISDSVSIRVLETPRVDLVDHGALPPERIVTHAVVVTFMLSSKRFSSRAFLTAFPFASLLKYTKTSSPS